MESQGGLQGGSAKDFSGDLPERNPLTPAQAVIVDRPELRVGDQLGNCRHIQQSLRNDATDFHEFGQF